MFLLIPGKSPGKSKSPSKSNPSGKPSNPKPKPPKPKPTAPNIEVEDDKKEFFDKPEDLSEKLDLLTQWIKNSKHCIIFTGAGISTSTGIRDFRSGMNTVLKTGPGKWELQAKGAVAKQTSMNYLKAVPSSAHMAIVKLHNEGLVKFVVSQNTDGLHLRSGIKPEQLAELHGNTNLEKCSRCGVQYLRDFRTRSSKKVHDHRTGRKCDDLKCRGLLVDSIINFGEDLPEKELEKGFDEAEKSDLCIVLGSSLRVTPAADIPERVMKRRQRLVICNLQKTPLNSGCAMELHAQIDEVMTGVMKRMGLDIPKFTLKRRLALDISGKMITFQGLDIARETPYSFLSKIDVKLTQSENGKNICKEFTLKEEPHTIEIPTNMKMTSVSVNAVLDFQGHYNESNATLSVKTLKTGRTIFILCYDFDEKVWNVQQV